MYVECKDESKATLQLLTGPSLCSVWGVGVPIVAIPAIVMRPLKYRFAHVSFVEHWKQIFNLWHFNLQLLHICTIIWSPEQEQDNTGAMPRALENVICFALTSCPLVGHGQHFPHLLMLQLLHFSPHQLNVTLKRFSNNNYMRRKKTKFYW